MTRITMINLGKSKVQEIVNEIRRINGMTKEEVASEIDLSREGLYHITNRSGKISIDCLEELKKLYKKTLKKELIYEEIQHEVSGLSNYNLEELIAEIKRRGGRVIFE